MTEGIAPTIPQSPTTEPNEVPETVEFFQSFWGVSQTEKFMLPDNKQYFEIKPMNEGAKAAFQRKTNRGIRMNQKTQDAHIDVDPADERHELITSSVVDCVIYIKDESVPQGFSEMPHSNERSTKQTVQAILQSFNPKIIQDLEFFIRTKNPWMQADMDLEQLHEERDRVELLIKQHKEEKAGEASSSSN